MYSGIFSLNENLLKCNIRKVKNDLKNIKDILSILEKGGVLKNKVSINFVNSSTLNKEFYLQKEEKLFYINDIKATLSLLYPFIDKVNKTKGEYTLYYLKLIPSIIERIKENTNNYLLFTEEQLSNLQKEKEKILNRFFFFQLILFITVIVINFVAFYFITKDIQSVNEELKIRLYYDKLTGLKNRIRLTENLVNKKGTLVILDIDKFGIYNELYGNKIGDEILKYVAKLLVDNFDKDSVYRIGSDDFAIFIQNNNLKIIDKLDSIFRKIKIKVNDIYIENLTFKAGILSIPNYLDNAFIALNIAKKENKHCHIFSQDDLQKEKEKIEYALYWTQKIENAIRNDLIVPVFQKIVDKNGNLFKYEMLLRVKDKDKLIPPFFLDIALQNNQYFDISKIMFKKAIEYINTKKISLSFNIFYLDIQNKNMYSFFKEEIKKCLYLELLTFEILESADIKDYELLNNKLEFFRNLGCKLAIDDFGSGYSNYRHILELKPNFLKIDGSLVKDILEDKNSLYIVESLQSLAKKTNIKTIAEFVENEEIFNKLKEIGIDYYQGYYFSKPSLL